MTNFNFEDEKFQDFANIMTEKMGIDVFPVYYLR